MRHAHEQKVAKGVAAPVTREATLCLTASRTRAVRYFREQNKAGSQRGRTWKEYLLLIKKLLGEAVLIKALLMKEILG